MHEYSCQRIYCRDGNRHGAQEKFGKHSATNAHFEPPADGSERAPKIKGAERDCQMDARKYLSLTFTTLKDLADGPQRAVIDRDLLAVERDEAALV
jgi:hypothetical protein